MHYRFTIFLLFLFANSSAQTLGGNSVFNFLKLSDTPQLTALGGVNVSHPSNDIGLAFNNPALLNPAMHSQANVVFNDFYGGIQSYHLSLGYYHKKLNSTFCWGLNYINYGSTDATDAAGNVLGEFRPTDWVMQLSAARSYLEKWNYGATIKYISSNYGHYSSNGIGMDAGLLFKDTAKKISASFLVKNMGFQLKKYGGTDPEDLPFDVQIGISKRMEKAPFGLSLTAQRFHQYNIRYDDTTFNNQNGFLNSSSKKFSAGKLLDHLVLAGSIYVGDRIEFDMGYNFLRRRELNIGNEANGLNGFSLGAGARLGKLYVKYARAYYQSNTAFNQLGLNLKLNEYFGMGKWGEKIGW
ncbi:MAG TPA: type IX secretion system protein PorQ [Chitinophagaceae bacterium]|nr:type IX secretion system protein PorQ [Chitinophagaceae bacterium]